MLPDNVCTRWINGWPTWMGGTEDEWLHCCVAHDAVEKSLEGDLALGRCVAEVSPTMAGVMVAGVVVIGPAFLWIRKRLRERKRNG
jgi:hypothetical protein